MTNATETAETQDMGGYFVIVNARSGSIMVPNRRFLTREEARQAWISEDWAYVYYVFCGLRFEIETDAWRLNHR